jgi:non-heme chloroperoxidase
MRKFSLFIIALSIAMLSGRSLFAQDISGDWQGTLKGAAQGSNLRLVVRITKDGTSNASGRFYSIDQPPEGLDGIPFTSLTVQNSEFRFSIGSLHASYEGKLSADGNSIDGTWRGRRELPLEFRRATKETAWAFETPQHTISFVTVDQDVKLEVLDFGGSGRPIIFLAGLGSTAHDFDQFGPKFKTNYHVYGITRRGYGNSSAPAPTDNNYSADRLGDDVLAVIDSLKLDRPVVAGHSIAGEELSSVGSRHPEKVAGLVYLDGGYWYAYYDRSRGDFITDAIELRRKLEQLILSKIGGASQEPNELADELLKTSLPQIAKDIEVYQQEVQATSDGAHPQRPSDVSAIDKAIIEGEKKYTEIRVPILAFFADPSNLGQRFKDDPAARARYEAWDAARKETVVKGFEAGLPSARVVRLPHADHEVWTSNEADVLREMNAFLRTIQ